MASVCFYGGKIGMHLQCYESHSVCAREDKTISMPGANRMGLIIECTENKPNIRPMKRIEESKQMGC